MRAKHSKPLSDDPASLWREMANYDLKTAQAMMRTGRLLYVAFMCHQCIEKSLKARHVSELATMPPFTHNLLQLLSTLSLSETLPQRYLKFITELNPYNIMARYPRTKSELRALLNKRRAARILRLTNETLKCLR